MFRLYTKKDLFARLDAQNFALTDKFNRQLAAIATALSVATGKTWADVQASIKAIVENAASREAGAAEKVRMLQAELQVAQRELAEATAARVEVEGVLADITATAVPAIELAALKTDPTADGTPAA